MQRMGIPPLIQNVACQDGGVWRTENKRKPDQDREHSSRKADTMDHVMSELGLTKEQTRLLFSFQHQLIQNDIENCISEKKKNERIAWCTEWVRAVNSYLRALKGSEPTLIMKKMPELVDATTEVMNNLSLNNRTPLYLILLELVLFHPYYPLKTEQKKIKIKYKRDSAKLRTIAELLSIEEEYVDKYIKSYKTAVHGITGFWPKVIGGALVGAILVAVTAGLAAPLIAGLFAPAGLAGAAATSAGLAALGGGAIAAGGAGMAGGIATIVGGGALLGLGSGLGVGKLLSSSPKFTLSEAAKLEVVMREITLTAQKDIRVAQEIIKEQRETLRSLDDELFKLQGDKDKNKKEIRTLEKSIQYLKKAIDRNRDFVEV